MDFSKYGYVAHGDTRSLISDLTPPLRFGSEVAIELLQHGAELWEANPKFSWEWQVVSSAGTTTTETDKERFTYLIQTADKNLKVQCTLKDKGKPTSICLALDFALVAGPYEAFWAKDNEDKAIVELIHDLHDYIESAAKSTGPNGVSARFIASVLFIEISNRRKQDRQPEIEAMANAIAKISKGVDIGNPVDYLSQSINLGKSFGVGQMKMSTLAMAKRMIPLIEHDPKDNTLTVVGIQMEFMKLTTDQMWELWRTIRWPKSHIQGVADLLAFLKNRANRFPGLDRAAFCKDRRAMAIVATEYNRGATSSSASAAGPTWYGNQVASCCIDAGVLESIYTGFSHA